MRRPVDAMEWASLFVELRERARTIDDIAQALAQEQGDPHTSELRFWAAAVRACVESHARDMEIVNPWARLQPKQTSQIVESLTEQVAGMDGPFRDRSKDSDPGRRIRILPVRAARARRHP